MKRLWWTVMLAGVTATLLAALPLSAAEVTVDGTGADRKAAILDAQRNAVATVVGQAVDSRTLVANFALVSDRILTSTQGYIRSYEVLEEETAPGGYRVRIRATIESASIRDDINAIAVLRASRGNPRFIVVPDPGPAGDALQASDPAVDAAARGISEYLSERQFEVVQAPRFATTSASGSPAMLKDLAFHSAGLGAEYAIYYSVTAIRKGAGRTFKQATAIVDLAVVHTGTYRVVAQVEERADGADRDAMEFAYRKAARQAAGIAAAKAVDLVLADWSRSGTTAGATFMLTLRNVKGGELESFEEALRRNGRVKSANRRTYADLVATIAVTVDGDLRDLGEAVSMVIAEKGWDWALTASDGSSLTYGVPEEYSE